MSGLRGLTRLVHGSEASWLVDVCPPRLAYNET